MTVIFSAKAGPVKATAAPSASVASMILVFDMVLSLWTSIDGADLHNSWFSILFPYKAFLARNFQATYRSNRWHTSREVERIIDGPVNAATNLATKFTWVIYGRRHWLCSLLVADGAPGR